LEKEKTGIQKLVLSVEILNSGRDDFFLDTGMDGVGGSIPGKAD
jgi:hypothetical protein